MPKKTKIPEKRIKVPISTGTITVTAKKPKEALGWARELKRTADRIEKDTKTKAAALQKSIAALQAKLAELEYRNGRQARALRADEKRVMNALQQVRAS